MKQNAIFIFFIICSFIMVAHGDVGKPIPRFFGELASYISSVLQKAKDLPCHVEWVKNINKYASKFNVDITLCTLAANDDFSTLIDVNKKITKTSKELISDCFKDGKLNLVSCGTSVMKNLWPLIDNIGDVFIAVSSLADIGSDCKANALTTLKKQIGQIKKKIKKCSDKSKSN